MRFIKAASIFACTFFFSSCQATNYKESCLTKFNNIISDFFEHPQLSGLADVAMDKIIDEAPASDIIGAMINAAVGNLTGGQYSDFSELMLEAYGQFGSYPAINQTIQKCLNGVNPPVAKLYPQITKQIKAQSAYNQKCNAGFKYVNGKLSSSFMHTIVSACKAKLSATEWSKATSLLKDYIKFEEMGFNV